jgi:adenylate cyclase
LADSYVLLGWNSYLRPKEAFPKGKVAAMGALRLDPDLGEAHMSLAGVLWLHDWQWQEAETEFKRSLTLNPAYPPANHWHAEHLNLVTGTAHRAKTPPPACGWRIVIFRP